MQKRQEKKKRASVTCMYDMYSSSRNGKKENANGGRSHEISQKCQRRPRPATTNLENGVDTRDGQLPSYFGAGNPKTQGFLVYIETFPDRVRKQLKNARAARNLRTARGCANASVRVTRNTHPCFSPWAQGTGADRTQPQTLTPTREISHPKSVPGMLAT